MLFSFAAQYIILFSLAICHVAAQSFFEDFYYTLKGQANESFGYSMTPISSSGAINLIVGAPRTSNTLPAGTGSLGGFFACDLKSSSCGPNLITGLGSHVWDMSNLGMSVASTYANGVGADESILVCDPRARVKQVNVWETRAAGVGVCYLFRPGQYNKYGTISYLPRLFDILSPDIPMLFGYSAVPISGASAYAFGTPYLMLGFGGTFYSSEFSAMQLNVSTEPLVMWGHSYVGGFRTNYFDMHSNLGENFDRFFPDLANPAEMQDQVLNKSALNYGCAGFAVATSTRLLGPRVAGGIDLVEGSPCVPVLAGVSNVSFREAFRNDYKERSAKWLGVGNGAVHLYRVSPDAGGSPLCGRTEDRTNFPGDPPNEASCFSKSSLQVRLIGPAFASRFGHALLALDLNADGWDDIVVSAPFTRHAGGGSHRIHGTVFVYMNRGTLGGYIPDTPDHELAFPIASCSKIDSPLAALCKAATANELWLGWSLAALGDVDFDGYADFAVGAPLARGGGAVLVYTGGRDGPRLSQVLFNGLADGFGESLSRGADFDASGYPDLMVGAPRHGSGSVFFFPARHVIRFALAAGQSVPVGLNSRAIQPISVEIPVWLNFTHQNESVFSSDSEKPTYEVKIQFHVDTLMPQHMKSRFQAVGLPDDNIMVVTAGSKRKYTLMLAYNGELSAESDMDTPLVVNATWWNQSPTPRSDGSQPFNARQVIRTSPYIRGVDSVEGISFRMSQINWKTGCIETPCQTELIIDCVSNVTRRAGTGELELLVDSSAKSIEVKCRISAAMDSAYGAYLSVTYNSDAFSLTSNLDLAENQPTQSTESRSNATVRLLLGNPLESGLPLDAVLLFKPVAVGPDLDRANFYFSVETRSRISEGSRTQSSLSVPVRTVVSVGLESLFTESMRYDAENTMGFNAFDGSVYKLTRLFPRLSVTLSNEGGAYLPTSYLVLHWPLETLPISGETNGKYLLYLQTKPYITLRNRASHLGGNVSAPEVTCDAAQVASVLNPLRLTPDAVETFAEAPPPPGSVKAVGLADGISAGLGRLPEPLIPPAVINGSLTNLEPECTRLNKFNFTYSCANSRCLPVVCRLGELSARMDPLRLTFVTVAYRFTFVEDNKYCEGVNIVPSVQWAPSPQYAGRIVTKITGSDNPEGPLLRTYNGEKLKEEDISTLKKVLIYGGGALLGAAILGFIILVLALCTPFFQRRRREAREQQAAVAATAEARSRLYDGAGGPSGVGDDYENAGGASAAAPLTPRSPLPPPTPPTRGGQRLTTGGGQQSLGRSYRFEEDENYR